MSDAAPLSPTDATPVDYRLNPAFAARFVGLALVLTAILMFVATALVAVLDLPADVLVGLLVVSVAAVFVLGWRLRSRSYVLRCDRDGYRVGLVRGAGVTAARWTEVADATTASPRGIPCVVLRLQDGRTTTLPVQALAIDREQFVRELQRHLQRGQGLRPL
ncbi:hypothetical protein [Nocardioides lianchengensis]|uniref:Uncharacterized protein n=1 Tax=Nocardioides lianchengensis TaxID=1045774 RepID=A0A1G7A1S5_9ACTN|nr:hypothetical protein [Nocardioides lianchengensis]NYG12321.1 apolipoprotein N-acyltransferase [Nocardioides lianchengensis]SDE08730.1 hypothetical protein SAMN05421872_114144 [Nocardioides lianchengensis]